MRYILATMVGLSLAGAASAQSVDQRHADQQQRIAQGVASGQLTSREATHDERQQTRIDNAEARDRARDNGHLTAANRAQLQARENRASAHIFRTKHNGRVR